MNLHVKASHAKVQPLVLQERSSAPSHDDVGAEPIHGQGCRGLARGSLFARGHVGSVGLKWRHQQSGVSKIPNHLAWPAIKYKASLNYLGNAKVQVLERLLRNDEKRIPVSVGAAVALGVL